jgi:hypothetical protein
VSAVPIPPGWRARFRVDGDEIITKPIAAVALVTYRYPKMTGCEPHQDFLPVVGWSDTGAFELATDSGFCGIIGPGEDE